MNFKHRSKNTFLWHNSVNIEAKNAKQLSLESSHRDESNDINFIKIESLVVLNTGVCRITKF